ncbi:MAG TPA: hypothetical protein VNX88_09390 [Terriglobales bacterium]|nr:hypothetical protein [Terriglobales bacterium]
MKRLGFTTMYEQNFVLQWVMSIGAAEELARRERFEFALVGLIPIHLRHWHFVSA